MTDGIINLKEKLKSTNDANFRLQSDVEALQPFRTRCIELEKSVSDLLNVCSELSELGRRNEIFEASIVKLQKACNEMPALKCRNQELEKHAYERQKTISAKYLLFGFRSRNHVKHPRG